MKSLGIRLEHAERQVQAKQPDRGFRFFQVHGYDPDVDVEDFLRQQGHDMDDTRYRDIIVAFVPAKDGKPAYEPYRDETKEGYTV